MSPRPKHPVSLEDLAQWVRDNNNDIFDTGDFPAIDDLADDEYLAAIEEYEAIADQIEDAIKSES